MHDQKRPQSLFASSKFRRLRTGALTVASCMALADRVFAQAGGSPWEQATQALQTAFTGPIATGLALVAIVLGDSCLHSAKAEPSAPWRAWSLASAWPLVP